MKNLKLTQDELLYILHSIEVFEDIVNDFCNPARTSLLEKLEKYSEENLDFRLNLKKKYTYNEVPYYHYLPTHLFGLSKEQADQIRYFEEIKDKFHRTGKVTFFECLDRIAFLLANYIEENFLYKLSYADELTDLQVKLSFRFNELFAPYSEALKLLDPQIFVENYQVKIQLCKPNTDINKTKVIAIEYDHDAMIKNLFESMELFD